MTTNPPAHCDEESYTVRRTIRIHADAARVWKAVTEPRHISRWFAQTDIDTRTRCGTMRFDDDPDHHCGTARSDDETGSIPFAVVASVEERSITYRWNNDEAAPQTPARYTPKSATEFTFTLRPDGQDTVLTVEETGFELTTDPRRNLHSHTVGWTFQLDKLVTLFDTTAEAAR
ncbi:SRPBCC domain-containing protein [Brevibacterium sp.]|uniref:SRPBCC domain-containing protein n=1 Tax=Brevibacterium sp. TaxID=1701 RepID=UPI00281129D5|nr:SRPBCC domain-containing protein [Brevibacterium sp.]